jgi:hypothetical protein
MFCIQVLNWLKKRMTVSQSTIRNYVYQEILISPFITEWFSLDIPVCYFWMIWFGHGLHRRTEQKALCRWLVSFILYPGRVYIGPMSFLASSISKCKCFCDEKDVRMLDVLIITTLVASANLLEPHCPAMEFVDLRLGATLVGATVIEELEMRPYSMNSIRHRKSNDPLPCLYSLLCSSLV